MSRWGTRRWPSRWTALAIHFCRRRSFRGHRSMNSAGQNLLANLLTNLGILQQVGAGLFLPLSQVDLAVFEPRAAASENLLVDPQVDDVPFVADAAGVH